MQNTGAVNPVSEGGSEGSLKAVATGRKLKSERFVEGRLKLSTSCTECHRRKQKVIIISQAHEGVHKRMLG